MILVLIVGFVVSIGAALHHAQDRYGVPRNRD